MSTFSLPVEQISDTAFLTALYRAMESERPDAHFRDPYARALAGARGEHVSQEMPWDDSAATGCAVRTCIIDELILRIVQENSVDTLLNLGAGLDTRPYRLPLPASLRWIEGDQPSVLTYKADKLANVQPRCALEFGAVDITDATAIQTLIQRIGTEAQEGFVLTEGLLTFMTEEQVAALARALHTQPQLRWWLSDLVSPLALRLLQKLLPGPPAGGEARMQFAPREGSEFFRRYGWETVEFHSLIEGAQRLDRGAFPEQVLARFSAEHWEHLRQMSGCVLLKRLD